MPYRRNWTRRSTRTAKKRTYKKRTYRRRYARTSDNKVYNYRVWAQYSQLNVSEVAINQNYAFHLVDVADYAAYSTLYDQYRINKIKLIITPRFDSIDAASDDRLGPMQSIIDYDGTGGTPGEFVNYQTYKQTRANQKHIRTLYPRVLNAVAVDSTLGTFAPSIAKPGWFDANTENGRSIRHYGINIYQDPSAIGSSSTLQYDVRAIYYMSFRNVR